jgi:hypothetical protein
VGQKAMPNTNMIVAKTLVPQLRGKIPAGETLLLTAVLALDNPAAVSDTWTRWPTAPCCWRPGRQRRCSMLHTSSFYISFRADERYSTVSAWGLAPFLDAGVSNSKISWRPRRYRPARGLPDHEASALRSANSGRPFNGGPKRAPFLTESAKRDKARQFLWFVRATVSRRPHS